jgi:hypothetical protein
MIQHYNAFLPLKSKQGAGNHEQSGELLSCSPWLEQSYNESQNCHIQASKLVIICLEH